LYRAFSFTVIRIHSHSFFISFERSVVEGHFLFDFLVFILLFVYSAVEWAGGLESLYSHLSLPPATLTGGILFSRLL